MAIPDDAVWQGTVDDGAWEVWVSRTDDYNGLLNVRKFSTQEVILSVPVTLSYGARFGPDMDDVADWQDKAVLAIDAALKR